jgi:hypothetical protein
LVDGWLWSTRASARALNVNGAGAAGALRANTGRTATPTTAAATRIRTDEARRAFEDKARGSQQRAAAPKRAPGSAATVLRIVDWFDHGE